VSTPACQINTAVYHSLMLLLLGIEESSNYYEPRNPREEQMRSGRASGERAKIKQKRGVPN